MGRSRKPEYAQAYRGFESHSLRQKNDVTICNITLLTHFAKPYIPHKSQQTDYAAPGDAQRRSGYPRMSESPSAQRRPAGDGGGGIDGGSQLNEFGLNEDKFWRLSPAAAEIFEYRRSNAEFGMGWGFDSGGVSEDRRSTHACFSCVALTGFG